MKILWLVKEDFAFENWEYIILVPSKIKISKRMLVDENYKREILHGGCNMENVDKIKKMLEKEELTYLPCYLEFSSDVVFDPIIKNLTKRTAKKYIHYPYRTNLILEGFNENNFAEKYETEWIIHKDIERISASGVMTIPEYPEYYTEEMDEYTDDEGKLANDKLQYLLPKEKEVC